jgi:hypothetical protein
MSRYEWERGSIKLSTVEWTKFRKEMERYAHRAYVEAFEMTQKVWKGLKASDKAKGDLRITDHVKRPVFGRYSSDGEAFYDWVVDLAELMFWQAKVNGKLARPQKTKVDFPTNKTTCFIHDDASISFDRTSKTVTWDVGENNHACERASESALGSKFFGLLNKIVWSRGTGGVIVGNDEYTREADYAGGGGNYVVAAYGPIGERLYPHQFVPFVDTSGKQHGKQHGTPWP